jgi:hypothetical protein
MSVIAASLRNPFVLRLIMPPAVNTNHNPWEAEWPVLAINCVILVLQILSNFTYRRAYFADALVVHTGPDAVIARNGAGGGFVCSQAWRPAATFRQIGAGR